MVNILHVLKDVTFWAEVKTQNNISQHSVPASFSVVMLLLHRNGVVKKKMSPKVKLWIFLVDPHLGS